ncbi:MAG: GAF domain-containing protein [Chloroflexi bacterium]|nr:GAF domain-containing protein [Chloroflexota bacterium]MCI0851205.1 GAF domain-containing protein [Chloroflexota bacterium]
MNEIYIALPFIQFAISAFLAVLVLMSNPTDRLNRLFTLFLVMMAAWGITIFAMRDAFPDAGTAYTREKWALAVIPFSSIFFLHFVLRYTRSKHGSLALYAFYSIGVASAILSLGGYTATGMVEKFYGFAPELGWAFPLVLMASYPAVLWSLVLLHRASKNEQSTQRRQQMLLLKLGVMASVAGATTDFFPSLGLNTYPLGVVGNIFFIVLATYGVTRYKMMNLRLMLRRGMAYSAVSSFLFGVYGLCIGIVLLVTRDLSPIASVLFGAGTVLIVGVTVQPVMQRVQAVVDKAFYRERHDRISALARLNDLTKDITDFPTVAEGIVTTVREAAQVDWVAVLLPSHDGKAFISVADTREASPHFELSATGSAISKMKRFGEMLTFDPTIGDSASDAENVVTDDDREMALFEQLDVRMIVPMIAAGNLAGLLTGGRKLVGSGFLDEDVEFVKTAAGQAAVAARNASLYAAARKEVSERSALAELGRVVSSTLDLETVFERCAEQVRMLLPADRIAIALADDEGQRFEYTYVSGIPVPGWDRGATDAIASSPLQPVFEYHSGITLGMTDDPESGPLHGMREASVDVGLNSLMAVPFIARGRVIGALVLESRRARAYLGEELALAERVAGQIVNAINNSRQFVQAMELAVANEAKIKLDAENLELQRLNEAKIEFLSTVSHELRTPLTSMLAFASLLKRNKEGNLTEKNVRHLDIIDKNGRRLNALIQDLLDVSRMDMGKLFLEPSHFDIVECVNELAESFAPIYDKKSQTLHLHTSDDEALIYADKNRIMQVLTNLLSNASKYSPESKNVWLSVAKVGDHLEFEVKDEGFGISEEDQKQMFTSFFRVDSEETRSVEGTGLGLVIAKGIVEIHGGQMKMESKIGIGTVFRFEIHDLDSDSPAGQAETDSLNEIAA